MGPTRIYRDESTPDRKEIWTFVERAAARADDAPRIPRLLSDKERNIIRGKALVGAATPAEMLSIFEHYDLIEARMTDMDCEDVFGTEGWRHYFGVPE